MSGGQYSNMQVTPLNVVVHISIYTTILERGDIATIADQRNDTSLSIKVYTIKLNGNIWNMNTR